MSGYENGAEKISADRRAVSSRGRRIADVYATVAIITLSTVVLVGCMEVAATLVGKLWQEPEPATEAEQPRTRVSYFTTQAWAEQYWKEFAASRRQLYRPFVTWRRAPFRGAFINIDRDGRSVTPGAVCSADSFKVFAFGGSTMWGTGSPDWGTIPAYLESELTASRRGSVCVVNFGESAYGSTQGVIQLMLELRAGQVPDLVIFYDGVNDTYSAYQSGRSTTHQNLTQVAAKFEKRSPSRSLSSLLGWVKASDSYRLLERLLTKSQQERQHGRNLITFKTMGVDTEALSSQVAKTYLGNYEVVRALARKYGFKPLFFWQPVLMVGGKPLTGEEQEMKAEADPALIELSRLVYRRVEQAAKTHEGLYYMGNVFDDFQPLVWIDHAHVTPEGNRMVAQEMLRFITQRGLRMRDEDRERIRARVM